MLISVASLATICNFLLSTISILIAQSSLSMTDSPFAPVALFVYNRLDHTKRTLEALAANYLAPGNGSVSLFRWRRDNSSWHSVETLREYLHEFAGAQRTGASRVPSTSSNVPRISISSATSLRASLKSLTITTIIVLEDDIVTAQGFLFYMNRAFSTLS